MQVGGSTDLYGGLLAGYDLLRRQNAGLSKHIFLLSDGEANSGPVQGTDAILRAVSNWEEKVPILSYGIGDGFNEKVMSPLGQVHRGSHYFYITDSASIEKLIARGVRALTGAVARNVRLHVRPLTKGVWFPDSMIDGNLFPLVRERSVIQFLLEVEFRPELPCSESLGGEPTPTNTRANKLPWLCSRRQAPNKEAFKIGVQSERLEFAWEVQGFPLLTQSSGTVVLTPASSRGLKNPEAEAFLDIRRGCDLRRAATSGADARKSCEDALRLFEGCLSHDRFGFAQEWADKTRVILDDWSLWRGNAASEAGAKHLGVAYAPRVDAEEEEEEDMDFDLFG